ncbi:uncharacterized protein LOC135437379 [Drosophila montana]|uniref:uncharacterized protein LOC135437379 n=1 Tax=Drosophila montana TaxID=40370 RepID=UPI00313B2782
MEKDLDFLINALSQPNSRLWKTYSPAQIREMRESFVMLQELLRHNPLYVERAPCHPVRFKAGGNTDFRPMEADLPPTVPHMNYQMPSDAKPSLTILASESASMESFSDSPSLISSSYLCGSQETLSADKQELATQGDDERSDTDNFLALVPYQQEETSQELVRYDPQYDDYESDSDTLRGSSSIDSVSGSGARSTGSSSIGGVSISIPMQMEYVWHNVDYKADSTDSDMTIIADGYKYILSN